MGTPSPNGAGTLRTQAGMLTAPGDSTGIGSAFAAALMESATTQLAPASAMLMALAAQLKCLLGPAKRFGIQKSNSKTTISAVSRRAASGAMIPVRMATAAAK